MVYDDDDEADVDEDVNDEDQAFVNERLHGYVMRGGDGLVHRYVGSQLEGRVAPTEGHVRRYWLPTPTPTPASTPNSRLKPHAYP